MSYLLDSSACIAVLRRHPAATAWYRSLSRDDFATSVIAEIELRVGAALHPSTAARDGVDALMNEIRVLELGRDVVDTAVRIRLGLRRAGTPLGANDLLIAATALTHGLTLVTSDRDFRRVPGLRVEDWTLPA